MSADLGQTVAGNGDVYRNRLAVLTNPSFYRRGMDVAIVVLDRNGDIVGHVEPFPIHTKPPGEYQTGLLTPTMDGMMGRDFLQSALEAAWEAGLRPKNWRLETTEQVAAMNNHLQDMRSLVFGKPVALIDPLNPTGKDTSNVR